MDDWREAWHSVYPVILLKSIGPLKGADYRLDFRTFEVLKQDNILGLLTFRVTCNSAVVNAPLLQTSLSLLTSLLMLLPMMLLLPLLLVV